MEEAIDFVDYLPFFNQTQDEQKYIAILTEHAVEI